ncbi:prolactin-releasing peptide receptor-like [Bradysia coprophila]|uniref:prolactin-releasing peptide receptor-like n=1 Tax=Bradysia coprophila TaxID=38358 RepID=UPI00187D90F2|nr:prolactin-releasing peptide receptor-like [Bradysia coprophila]
MNTTASPNLNFVVNDSTRYTTVQPNIVFEGVELQISNTTHLDYIHNRMVQTFFIVMYCLIFTMGVFGNVLVCFVVFRNRLMQSVTNLFITNLALSDILLCILAIPFTPTYTFLRRWIFGTILCHLVPYAQGVSVYTSTLTLMAIAIDRFFVIIYPFQQRMKVIACIVIILIIWMISLMLTLPYGLYMQVAQLNFTGEYEHYCEEDWPSEHYRRVYGSITTTLQFLLPFAIVTFCYVCVSVRLNYRARMKPGAKTTKKEEVDRDRKRRTNRMLIVMVAVFGLSWLPLNVVNVLNDFYLNTHEWKVYNVLFFIAHSIAMSSTCYNPILYAWLNDNFRKEFKLVIPCLTPLGRLKCISGSQRWYTETTCNGTETMQESLLTSSFTRSNCPSLVTRDSIQLNGFRSPLDHSILLSDVVPTCRQRSPETVLLPSGVLETNFDEPLDFIDDQPSYESRIRFEEDSFSELRAKEITNDVGFYVS